MERTLPRPLVIPWRFVLLTSYAIVNIALVVMAVRVGPDVAQDWWIFAALEADNLYANPDPIPFVWSPPMGWIMVAVASVGYWPWVVAHVASVFLLRSPLLIGLVLVSYGFWFDTAQGNTLTFSLVAGMLALRDSRWGSFAYLGLFVLMPRPLLLPLAVWLVWKRPELRWPATGMAFIAAVLTLASGQMGQWLETLLSYRGPAWDIGPTAVLGAWWLAVGIPLAAWFTYRGHVGWAGLAMSPYILPQYLVWPLVGRPDRATPR